MLNLILKKRLPGQSQMLHQVVLMIKLSKFFTLVFAFFGCVLHFTPIADFHAVCRYLVSQGCIKPLCDLLICPDPRIVTVCLEGLENILKIGEAEKNMGNTGGVNQYAQLIDDADGLEKIENLQSHDNTEIYEKAVKILETYWLEDEDDTMPPGDASQSGFNFGGSEAPTVPSGGFNFS